MVGVRIEDRPEFFERALVFIQENRLRTGRPHWLIIDEAHHMFSSERPPTPIELTGQVGNIVLVTVHPEHVSPAALKAVNTVIAVGRNADNLIRQFCRVADLKPPEIPTDNPAAGEAFVWLTDSNQPIARVQTEPPRGERGRHKRKYAEGKIEDDRVFHFRGPEDKLNLRAQNLTIFMQIAEGVDDATWLFHLRRGDYSKWMRDQIKDAATADQIEAVEQDKSLSPQDSRSRIGKVIEEKYTSPL
jgi:hypothetical protein